MKLNKEYKEITGEILESENFAILKNDVHHGSNKYDHCKRVSYLSYLMAKLFNGNCREVARAGLLHDFFFGSRTSKVENGYLKHPKTSVENAKKYFDIDENEASIIESHMYHHALLKRLTPFMKEDDKKYFKEHKPKNKDSVIVCVSDLLVSIFEVCAYKIRYNFYLYMIFILNIARY
ncbi:MAG: HD domain-containing protein [Firmicutes bacterium]|nr:HD domain-containing protein [Bacillota bacterium]